MKRGKQLRAKNLRAPLCALLLLCPSALWSASSLPCGEESPAGSTRSGRIGVLSVNLHEVEDSNLILGNLRQAGDLDRADLILLQEVIRPGRDRPGVADRMAESLGMQVFFAPAFGWHKGSVQGLAILSRYPILERHVISLPEFNLRWRSRHRIALGALVETPAGRIYVYNVHLDTRLNLDQRLLQLRPVVAEASRAEGPVLVGGDFNTNPFGWFQHTIPLLFGPGQPVGVQQYMNGLGFKSAFPRKTVTSRWLRMQLDWIFLRGLRVESAADRPMKFSDHYAIYGCLDLPPGGTPQHPALEEPQQIHHDQANKPAEGSYRTYLAFDVIERWIRQRSALAHILGEQVFVHGLGEVR